MILEVVGDWKDQMTLSTHDPAEDYEEAECRADDESSQSNGKGFFHIAGEETDDYT
jgi:hypothetical protein